MATVAELELKIRVLTERLEELERAKRGTDQFRESVAGLRNQILALGTALIGLDKLRDFVDTGVEVNKALESARIGIAGIVASQAELRDSQGAVLEGQEAFNAATVIASDQLKKLKVDSLQTTATFGTLKDAFQAAMSPGLAAGLNLDQIRGLVKEIALTAGALGLGTEQIAQETGAILTGNIDNNAVLARNLGITNEMVSRWKEQGTLAQELEKRLHGFVLAGDATAKSWAGVTSNMQEAYETLAGLSTAGFYDAIKSKLNDALSGVFDLKTGELEESLQGVSGLLTEILTDLGEVIGDSIVGMVDGIKQFSAYIKDNQGEIRDMEANFGLVFDQVKAIAGGVLEAVKAIVSAGTEAKVLSNTFEVIAGTLAAFRDGVDFISLSFTKLGAVVLESLAFPIEKAGKLLSAFGLEIGRIMQDTARHMQSQAKAADDAAGQMWQNFADGKTHLAALNAEAEKFRTLIEIPRSGGFDDLRDQILDFTAKLKEAKPPMEEIRAEAERLRSQVQIMFDAGQLSREEYIVALAKIDGGLERVGASANKATKTQQALEQAATLAAKKTKEVADASSNYVKALESVADAQLDGIRAEIDLADAKGDTYTAQRKSVELARLEAQWAKTLAEAKQADIVAQRAAIEAQIAALQAKNDNAEATQKEIAALQLHLVALGKQAEAEQLAAQAKALAAQQAGQQTSQTERATEVVNANSAAAEENAKANKEAAQSYTLMEDAATGAVRELSQLSAGTNALLSQMLGLRDAGKLFGSEWTGELGKLKLALEQTEGAIRHNLSIIGPYAGQFEKSANAANAVRKAYLEQAIAAESLGAELTALNDDAAANERALSELASQAANAKKGFGLLDNERLAKLQSAIDAANDRLREMRQVTQDARNDLAELNAEIAAEKGDTAKADRLQLELDRKRAIADADAKLAEAQAANNAELVALYEEQKRKLEELYRLKEKNLEADIKQRQNEGRNTRTGGNATGGASSTTTAAPSAPAATGGGNISLTVNASNARLLDGKFAEDLARQLWPVMGNIGRRLA